MKRFLVLLVAFVSLNAFAQGDATSSIKFGYLSYQAAIKAMPDYTLVQRSFLKVSATSQRAFCRSVRQNCRS